MLRIAHPHSAPVMDRHPAGSCGRVDQRIQQRPVGDGITAVQHAFRLPVRRGHGAGIQMIPADDHRSGQLPGSNHIVEELAERCPLAVAEPADPGRQALEGNFLPG
ncbi:hypothetical protein D3C71_1800780 [compost metagenome]